MNLDAVTAELRPRGPWEAADLGARMIRRDARAVYAAWFAVTLPLLALASLAALYGPWPTLAIFAYWWLEPLADAPVLHILSRRLFGERADAREALRALPRAALRNLIFLLPPYRLHFARSVAMPVTQLEGARGATRRRRARVLNRLVMGHGIGVTVVYQHLVLVVVLGVMLLGLLLVPAEYVDDFSFGGLEWLASDEGGSVATANLLLFYLGQTLLEPWFVGAGFGLYINCRTQLEAWDIEVSFRRMAAARARRGAAAALLVGLAGVWCATLAPVPAAAASPPPASQDGPSPGDPGFAGIWEAGGVAVSLERIFDSEELRVMREIEVWERKKPRERRREPGSDDGVDMALLLSKLTDWIAVVVESALWIAAGLLVALLVLTRKLWLPYLRPMPRAAQRRRRVVLAGGEVSAETLPDDVPAEVARLWAEGRARDALSLLYRGSVLGAVERHGVEIPVSATEGACVAAVSARGDGEHAEFFRRVVRTWLRLAYGRRRPDDATVAELCAGWPTHYGGAP